MEKKYSSIIIEILLIISIMLAALSIFVKYVVLDKNTYLNILNKNGTYEQIKDSIYVKIDDVLKAKNINIDIKESIITEEDIKKEADNMISDFVEYLKTGENNVKPIDIETYKQRVKEIIGNIIKPTNSDLALNGNLQTENIVSMGNDLKYNNMIVSKEKSNDGQPTIEVEKLETRSEAEAKVRDILKQKGLTEEEAIQKAIKKGITEEQALKILADYGITIDDESEGTKATSEGSNNGNGSDSNNSSSVQGNSGTTEESSDEISSNNQTEDAINKPPADKSIKNQLDGVLNKLLDDAGSNIEKEIEKINLNKMLQSSKVQKLAQITSIIYKMFWMIMILPFVLMAIVIKLNSKDLILCVKYVRNAFLLTGLILFAIFFSAYILKVYDKPNINIVYLKDVVSYTIKRFLIVLSTFGIITFIIGLILSMPITKKLRKKN